jgi:hypothetical protein
LRLDANHAIDWGNRYFRSPAARSDVLPEAEVAGPGLGEIFSLFPLAQVNNRINPRRKCLDRKAFIS